MTVRQIKECNCQSIYYQLEHFLPFEFDFGYFRIHLVDYFGSYSYHKHTHSHGTLRCRFVNGSSSGFCKGTVSNVDVTHFRC